MKDCTHPVKLSSLCAICGFDTSNTKNSLNTHHSLFSSKDLTITKSLFIKSQSQDIKNCLDSKKLNLVIDLDETVIHTELFQLNDINKVKLIKDSENLKINDTILVNNILLKKISNKIFLQDNRIEENSSKTQNNEIWYCYWVDECFLKTIVRPYYNFMVANLLDKYIFYVYTNGTRNYANIIVEILNLEYNFNILCINGSDKTIKDLFEDRIISRDENTTGFNKTLSRIGLSPFNTIILDDRLDIWNFEINVIPVKSFTGNDINEINNVLKEVELKDSAIKRTKTIKESCKLLQKLTDLLGKIHSEFFEKIEIEEYKFEENENFEEELKEELDFIISDPDTNSGEDIDSNDSYNTSKDSDVTSSDSSCKISEDTNSSENEKSTKNENSTKNLQISKNKKSLISKKLNILQKIILNHKNIFNKKSFNTSNILLINLIESFGGIIVQEESADYGIDNYSGKINIRREFIIDSVWEMELKVLDYKYLLF